MKFPESWLADFVELPLKGEALAHALTMAGLESEELLPVAPPFSGVVVAKVLSVTKHPDADRLNVCQVDVGDGSPRQIVCGAPNVAAGMVVPCALPGAVLPGDFKIKLAKVRGVESSGMLCSAKELGLTADADGLLSLDASLVPGADFRAALALDDVCHLLKLTPNRGDCLSILGVAREIGALTGAPVRVPAVPVVPVTSPVTRKILLGAPAACPRYLGRIVTDVDAKAPVPEWMRQRLERSGLRSISALVDITNYVMLELGQPLHAFDNAKLEGAVQARLAQPGDKLLLLNGQTIDVDSDVLVIADDVKALAMAGIMGGEDSGITLETRSLFLESAFFAPQAVAGRARRYGFGSDASHRFERGVDFAGARRALERATELVLQICGGNAAPVVEAVAELPQRNEVRLRLPRLAKVLGVALPAETVCAIFTRLGLASRMDGDSVWVTPSSARFDLEIEEDLIEEVARLYGYDNIPVVPPRAALSMLPQGEPGRSRGAIRGDMVDLGYQEVINFAFVEEAWENDFAGNDQLIRLANPIASQMSVMRSTLIGGLVANLVTNQRRKQPEVRVFELGRCFSRTTREAPVEGFHQPWKLAALAWGGSLPEQWGVATRRVDFFDAKGNVEQLLNGLPLRFSPADHPALHPGRSAWVFSGDARIGVVGELHPRWVQKYDLAAPPVVFELELDYLLGAKVPMFAELSNQPVVVRDLALVVDARLPLQSLLDTMKARQPAVVREIKVFDLYHGKGVPEGKKSLAFRVVMQDTQKTLQDAEVDSALQKWVSELGEAVGAQLRA
ncbi:MAG TPA: phenylalanine--tRNA ligase subunit beta [Rhodocyclaceae bacterium]|nr:phenylalanine--tRNA ligase subunit beta [Rhodocyclaceae bacterium]